MDFIKTFINIILMIYLLFEKINLRCFNYLISLLFLFIKK
ncbi:putative membrane protein [Acinetobacter sp. 25977_6]|nr:putative membrane protein [Acinetobacter sp. 21871]EXR60289.1 putative membrane protein [Acinetobacter sp. 1424608]EXT39473.1 putative membrane protein [Acinetobacter sp. 25977_8]EXT43581.1 putative membrane protein [Acinetobacter sp. 25977_7]EXT44940.1 putative membrane protein [Acinetobacter sp. 25977_6]EXT49577.1 putative membrane protein [Acinetobacter sp. 25977_4]EXT57572.1 putative membrane protein [Acinetobacter sp. 25977_3]EXT60865.1 putative membrane protein [Acinetobacter sp. 25